MKLIALSDIHGSYASVLGLLRAEWPWDGLVIAGDLTTLGSGDEASAALDDVLSFGAPVAAICGNMDPPHLETVLTSKGVSINGKGVLWGDVGIFGVSGSPKTPMHTPYEIPEEEIMQRAVQGWEHVKEAAVTIFVPHAPPRGTALDTLRSGVHVGSTSVRSFVEDHALSVLVCGHIHEARGTDRIGGTMMVNCGPAGAGSYAVIDIGDSVTIRLEG